MKILLILMGLITTLVSSAQIKPADGFWRTSDDPAIGSGLLISTQGAMTLVSVFTYDEQGKNAWYIAAAQVSEQGLFEAELFKTQNGSGIVADNPQSAEAINTHEVIKIQFLGNQIGELSVGESVNKSIQTMHFGTGNWQTAHQTLPDGTHFRFPSIEGSWAVGSSNSEQTMILDLDFDPILSDGRLNGPYQGKVFVSQHTSTMGWLVSCPWDVNELTDPVLTPYCTVYDAEFEEPVFTINFEELGGQKMLLNGTGRYALQQFKGFKIESASKPHNGHWRTHDDPAVGSGLYLVTQGDITLAILYSYNEEGDAEWSIANGVIDEAGNFQAELLSTNGGKPLYIGTPLSAEIAEETRQLSLTFQGAELGTISIDGSAPKFIQLLNYGTELFETEQLTVEGEKFRFPNQAGRWLVVDSQQELLDIVELAYYDPNCCISPAVPWYVGARAYTNIYDPVNGTGRFYLDFICTVTTENFTLEEDSVLIPYCTGVFSLPGINNSSKNMKLYFEDIGVNSFKAYLSESSEATFEQIDRDSDFLTFYRLE